MGHFSVSYGRFTLLLVLISSQMTIAKSVLPPCLDSINVESEISRSPSIGFKLGGQSGSLQRSSVSLESGIAADIFLDIPLSRSRDILLSIELYIWNGKTIVDGKDITKFGSRWLLKQRVRLFDADTLYPIPYIKAGLIGPNAPYPPIIIPINFCFGVGVEFNVSRRLALILDMQAGYTLLPGNIDPNRGFYYPSEFLAGLKFSFD